MTSLIRLATVLASVLASVLVLVSRVVSPVVSSRPKKNASTRSWNSVRPLPSAITISGPQSRNGIARISRSASSGGCRRGRNRR